MDIHTAAMILVDGVDAGIRPEQLFIPRPAAAKTWRALLRRIRLGPPSLNKAVSGQYAPGSTFKMLVALAGLESGRVSLAPDIP